MLLLLTQDGRGKAYLRILSMNVEHMKSTLQRNEKEHKGDTTDNEHGFPAQFEKGSIIQQGNHLAGRLELSKSRD